MKKWFICLSVMAFSLVYSKDYLAGKIPETNCRWNTMQKCLELLEERQAKVLVETGTARDGDRNCSGDGCSTIIFGDWAFDHEATLFSIDISPAAIANARYATRLINPEIQYWIADSCASLASFGSPIDFLYLDSYDFEFDNPTPSQEHHLKEIKAALPFLHDQTVIMIDDCSLPHGGKGKLVIEFLLEQGWSIYLSNYQVIMLKSAGSIE